jgi:hypothetical protein
MLARKDMNLIIEIDQSLLTEINGGQCSGAFIGTKDGKYGICIGISQD